MAAVGGVLKEKPISGNSPSDFKARITLEYPVKTPDGAGGSTITWAVVQNPNSPDDPRIWAIVNDFQSDEMVLAMQTTGALIHKIRIRYRTDVKSNWRIGYNGKYWSILGPPIDYMNQHRFLDLKAKETA